MEAALTRRSVPAVRSGCSITALFAVSSDTSFECQKRMVIANDNKSGNEP